MIALVLAGLVAWVLSRKNGRFSSRPGAETLTAADIGSATGERATLLQFSSVMCSPCRATRALLIDIATTRDGVLAVDLDAEEHPELVRRLGVMRTPTIFVLDADGAVATRASGAPRRDQVLAALDGIGARSH